MLELKKSSSQRRVHTARGGHANSRGWSRSTTSEEAKSVVGESSRGESLLAYEKLLEEKSLVSTIK